LKIQNASQGDRTRCPALFLACAVNSYEKTLPMDELMTGLSVKQVGNSEKLHWIERRSRPLKEKTRSYSVTCLCARRVYSFSL